MFLFAALGGHQNLIEHEWNDFSIRLAIDVGMLAIALVSIAMKMPFTLQYAREQVDAETMREPKFLQVNYVLSWAWVGAMLLMLVADISDDLLPGPAAVDRSRRDLSGAQRRDLLHEVVLQPLDREGPRGWPEGLTYFRPNEWQR